MWIETIHIQLKLIFQFFFRVKKFDVFGITWLKKCAIQYFRLLWGRFFFLWLTCWRFKWLFHKLGLSSVPDTIEGLLCIHETQGFNSKWVAAAKVGVMSSLWCLWNLRNKRIFNEEVRNTEGLIDSINHCIALWLFSKCKDYEDFSLSDLVRDWACVL